MQITHKMYQTDTVQTRAPNDALREASGNKFAIGLSGSRKTTSASIAGLPEPLDDDCRRLIAHESQGLHEDIRLRIHKERKVYEFQTFTVAPNPDVLDTVDMHPC